MDDELTHLLTSHIWNSKWIPWIGVKRWKKFLDVRWRKLDFSWIYQEKVLDGSLEWWGKSWTELRTGFLQYRRPANSFPPVSAYVQCSSIFCSDQNKRTPWNSLKYWLLSVFRQYKTTEQTPSTTTFSAKKQHRDAKCDCKVEMYHAGLHPKPDGACWNAIQSTKTQTHTERSLRRNPMWWAIADIWWSDTNLCVVLWKRSLLPSGSVRQRHFNDRSRYFSSSAAFWTSTSQPEASVAGMVMGDMAQTRHL